MVNAVAIATADLIQGKDLPDELSTARYVFRLLRRKVYIDNSIFMSERMTGHRNRAIGHLMRNSIWYRRILKNRSNCIFSSAQFL